MSANALEKTERRSTVAKLDDATIEAVLAFGKTVRAKKELERVVVSRLTRTQQDRHKQDLAGANWNYREARLGLERLLEEDG